MQQLQTSSSPSLLFSEHSPQTSSMKLPSKNTDSKIEEELDFDEEALFQLLEVEEELPPPSQSLSELGKSQKKEIDALFESQPCTITVQSQKEIESSLKVPEQVSTMVDESSIMQASQVQSSVMNSTLKQQQGKEDLLSLDDMDDFITDDMKGILFFVC